MGKIDNKIADLLKNKSNKNISETFILYEK